MTLKKLFFFMSPLDQSAAMENAGQPRAPETSSWWKTVSRRIFNGTKATARAISALAVLTLPAYTADTDPPEKPRIVHQGKMTDIAHGKNPPDEKQHERKLPDDVIEKLRQNKEGAEKMSTIGVQKYLDEMQKENPILLAEDSVPEVSICCIDERQFGIGGTFDTAGATVMMSKQQKRVLAGHAVDLARRKYERMKQPITIRMRPHLAKDHAELMCGAGAEALRLQGRKNIDAKAVDEEVMKAAGVTARFIEEHARSLNVPVKVMIDPVLPKNMVGDYMHPGTATLINGTDDEVMNHERATGMKFFATSVKLAGEDRAIFDALLAARIALRSGHGQFEDAQNLRKDIPHRLIVVGTEKYTPGLRKKTEDALRADRDLGPLFAQGKITVDMWIRSGQKEAQPERKQP